MSGLGAFSNTNILVLCLMERLRILNHEQRIPPKYLRCPRENLIKKEIGLGDVSLKNVMLHRMETYLIYFNSTHYRLSDGVSMTLHKQLFNLELSIELEKNPISLSFSNKGQKHQYFD